MSVKYAKRAGFSRHLLDKPLLKEDDKRREKQLNDLYPMSWEKPLFDSPFESRRHRILNSLFFAVAKMNGKSSVHGREAREIRIPFSNSTFRSASTGRNGLEGVPDSQTPTANREI
ncbi:MAG: hypothetical protein WA655_08180 [Candidatus Korobacteraceae bacterium]